MKCAGHGAVYCGYKKARPESGSVFFNFADGSQLAVALIQRIQQPEVEQDTVTVGHGLPDVWYRALT